MKESDISKPIFKILTELESYKKLKFQRNNSGRKGNVSFGKSGSPDFYIFFKNGVTVQIETKKKKGKQQENQKEWQADMLKLDHIYLVIDSLDQFQKYLKLFL
jgi:hypothetical protein